MTANPYIGTYATLHSNILQNIQNRNNLIASICEHINKMCHIHTIKYELEINMIDASSWVSLENIVLKERN